MDKGKKLEWQRKHRAKNKNADTLKYEKTKKGFLMRTYRNMLSRTSGTQKTKAHLYYGLELLNKNVFYSWALDSPEFNKLFKSWENDYYNRRLTPSIDRINSTKGYILDNVQWLTHSENSKKTVRNLKT